MGYCSMYIAIGGITMKYAINLRHQRLLKYLTQKQLARLSGVSQTHISSIELGTEDPSLKVIFKLASGLNICYRKLISCEFECKICSKNYYD